MEKEEKVRFTFDAFESPGRPRVAVVVRRRGKPTTRAVDRDRLGLWGFARGLIDDDVFENPSRRTTHDVRRFLERIRIRMISRARDR